MDITYSKPSSDISRMRTQEMGFSLDITGKVRENAAYGKEELKSAEEIAQMAGMTDVSVQRDYMAVMSNSMSDEDFAKLMEDGKGKNVVLLNISELNSWTDYFVIVTVSVSELIIYSKFP